MVIGFLIIKWKDVFVKLEKNKTFNFEQPQHLQSFYISLITREMQLAQEMHRYLIYIVI